MRCSGPAGAAQRPQRGDSGDQIQQPRLQGRHGRQRRRRSVGGRQPDQHHEDRYQRQRDHHDHRRFQVVDRDHGDGGRGQDRGKQQGGQVSGEVGAQAVETAGDHHRGVVALGGEFTGLAGGHRRQHLTAEIGDDRAGPALTQAGLQPVRQRANNPQRQQDRQRAPARRAGCGAEGSVMTRGDDAGQHDRRADRTAGDHHAAAHRRRPGSGATRSMPATVAGPGGPGSPRLRAQDARLARPIDGGIRSAEIRCRKTQYVQAW